MKDFFKRTANLYTYILLAGIVSCITFVGFAMLFNVMFTEEIGYEVYRQIEDDKSEYLYTYKYPSGVADSSLDKEWKNYKEKG